MADKLDLGDLIYKLGFENEAQFVAALNRLMDTAETSAGKGGKAAGGEFSKQFGLGLKDIAIGSFIGTQLSAAFTASLDAAKQFARDSIAEFRGYKVALNTLAASGESDLGSLQRQIKSLSDTSKVFSENDIASSLSEMVKAGLSAADAMELVANSTNVARAEINPATGELGDLTAISLQLSDVLAGFGVDAKNAASAVDVLAQGALDSKLSISELSAAVGPIGSLAKTAGLGLEQTVASLAKLRDTGLSASESSTQLRTVLQAAIAPAAGYKDRMQELGLTIVKADGSLRPFSELLGNIEQVSKQGGRGLEFLSTVFGSYGVNAAIALSRSRDAIDEQTAALANSGGAAKRFGDQMLQGVEQSKEFETQIKNAKLALGEQLQPVLAQFYTQVAPQLVSSLRSIIDAWSTLNLIMGNTKSPAEEAGEALSRHIAQRLGNDKAALIDNRLEISELKASMQTRQQGLDELKKNIFSANTVEARTLEAALARDQEQLKVLEGYQRALEKRIRAAKPKPAAAPASPKPAAAPSPGPINLGPTSDAILERVKTDTQKIKIARDELELAGGLEAALGKPALLRQYVGDLDKIAVGLKKLQQTATTPDQKQAVLGALIQIKHSREELATAQRAAFEAVLKQSEGEIKVQMEAFGEQLKDQYGDGVATTIEAIRRSYKDVVAKDGDLNTPIKEALAAGFDPELVFAAFPAEFAKNITQAMKSLQTDGLADFKGYVDFGAKLGQSMGQAAGLKLIEELVASRNKLIDTAALKPDSTSASSGAELVVPSDFTQTRLEDLRYQQQELEAQFALGALSVEDYRKALLELDTQYAEFDRSAGATTDQLIASRQAASQLRAALLKLGGEALPDWLDKDSTPVGEAFSEGLRAAETDVGVLIDKLGALPEVLGPEDFNFLDQIEADLSKQLLAMDALVGASAALAPSDQELEAWEDLRTKLREMAGYIAGIKTAGSTNLLSGDTTGSDSPTQPVTTKSDQTAIINEYKSAYLNVARSFTAELLDGTPDIGAALKAALGSGADFFVGKMLEGILGPIAEELARATIKDAAGSGIAAAGSAAAGMGPIGLAIAGTLALGSLIAGLSQTPEDPNVKAAERARREGRNNPSINYNASATINVDPGLRLRDPEFILTVEALAERVSRRLLRQVGAIKEPV
jgi:TP901 family phage tail tape measure protein